jgi:hypothetical protein
MKIIKSRFLVLSTVISLLAMNPAFAARPSNISGDWAAVGNLFPVTLTIVQGIAPGLCKPITGTYDVLTIEGRYCPADGRIVFVSSDSTGVPYQLVEAHVSRDGFTDYMGGSIIVWNLKGSGLIASEGVDYNFSAKK